MTASTVHAHHARSPKHPMLDRLGDTTDHAVVWVTSGDALRWLRARPAGVSLWVKRHLYGLVITAIALTFVTGCVVTFAMNQDHFWAILFALVGYPSIAGAVAYHWGDPS